MIRRMMPLLLLLAALSAVAQESTPPQLTPEAQQLAAEALKLNGEAVQLYQRGQAAAAVVKARAALANLHKVYPASNYPDGHADLAGSLNNLGVMLRAMGSYEQALPYYEQSMAILRKLYPASKYPDGHPNLAAGLNNLGFLLKVMGSHDQALTYYEQALAMAQRLLPASKYPDGHPNLAICLNNLGSVLEVLGSYEKSLPLQEQALAMRRKLYPVSKYPHGHADLAQSLNNLGVLLQVMGWNEKALPYHEQALAMRQALYPETSYPNGHSHLATSLNNLGGLLQAMSCYEKALPYWEQALAMNQHLFPASKHPDGHPDLAGSTNNLGFLWNAMGRHEKALPLFEQALAMSRNLYPASIYPDGHADLARCLMNLGGLLEAMGSYEKALPYYEQSLAVSRKISRRKLATAAESEALAFVSVQPLTRDAFLSLTAHLPDTTAAAYRAVWVSKAAITQVLEQRHAAARAAGLKHTEKLNELKGLHRYIDQLFQDRRLPPAERDQILAKATDTRDALERELAKAIPMLQRAKELAALGPESLVRLMPDQAALIDFIRYTRIDYDRAAPGRMIQTRTLSYAAFVLVRTPARTPLASAPGSPFEVRRIELGAALPIDRAATLWRNAIESGTESAAAIQLRDLVWAKLAPHLPGGTKTLYLALDGDLARVPWVALPTGKERVLLQVYAIATVPHGPFLLEALMYPRADRGNEAALLVGALDYNSPAWPVLSGTAAELTALTSLAPAPLMTLTKGNALPDAVAWALKKARYAHLATHGYFDAEALAADKKRADQAMQTRQFGDEMQRFASKNPLTFTGLVLAGGEVFTGLSLVDLHLENLKLVTLSACETGLGEYTAGEGVQGLQRAFHLAGCPNVVASLWKVNDAATAALMAQFYHEMWVNKRSPIEALREAQLTIYRHPELIPDLAGERGPVRLRDAVAAKTVPSANRQATADTKLWAAFVLSGVGK